ncbi:hypothetical protein SAMN04488055_0024 [Chitinophaga niabensis]|uniref:Esterase n=2 Tax=Chitinophaga niabensis TaxID=536979 RepID=A0A1N6D0C2_9BACT|nr:hypothetical protein SAMN04488055_0024 [Chitinophaga niabensis]
MPVFAQTESREKLYSNILKDTVYYNVVVPEGRDINEPLPALYALKYGMIDGPYIASQLRYFKGARYPVLNMIVVTVLADMDRIGFVYETGLLTETGKKFLACLKNEIIADVERKYHVADFRAYVGHSYAASYANYLFQHEPGIFNGYILLAPEKVNAPFVFDARTIHRKTFYYAAVGEFDLERRHVYAKNICNQLKSVDSSRLFTQYDSIPRGDHSNILTMAIQPAVEFISQCYDPNADVDPGKNAWDAFANIGERITKTYGVNVEKNYVWYSRFAQLAISRKDSASLIKLLDHFSSDKLKGYDTRTFGDYCARLGLMKRAEHYYLSTIQKVSAIREKEGWEFFVLSDCYRGLAMEVEKNDHEKAWEYLQKALQVADATSKYGSTPLDTYFEVGRFLIDNGYRVKEGVGYLLKYLQLRSNTLDEIHWGYGKIHTNLGKGYYLLKDYANTRLYLQKALAIDQDNKEAKELLKKLN